MVDPIQPFRCDSVDSVPPPFVALPDEVIAKIFYFLDTRSILAMSLTSKRFWSISQETAVWDAAVENDFSLNKNAQNMKERGKGLYQTIAARMRWMQADKYREVFSISSYWWLSGRSLTKTYALHEGSSPTLLVKMKRAGPEDDALFMIRRNRMERLSTGWCVTDGVSVAVIVANENERHGWHYKAGANGFIETEFKLDKSNGEMVRDRKNLSAEDVLLIDSLRHPTYPFSGAICAEYTTTQGYCTVRMMDPPNLFLKMAYSKIVECYSTPCDAYTLVCGSEMVLMRYPSFAVVWNRETRELICEYLHSWGHCTRILQIKGFAVLLQGGDLSYEMVDFSFSPPLKKTLPRSEGIVPTLGPLAVSQKNPHILTILTSDRV